MPKRVDHQQRRREIADALLRVVGVHGLHGMSLREVAAEAGVSLRLVQYYFPSKEQLLLFTAGYLTRRLSDQVTRRVAAAGPAPSPRSVIEATLAALLPTDPDTRRFHLAHAAFAVLAMTDSTIAAQAVLAGPDAREELLVQQLRTVLRPPADPRAEAVGLLAMSSGLATSVLGGVRSVDEALGVLRHHLDRVLPARAPARVGGW
ncbi:TetR/AcrR family transcriptional regulator [Cryptosporangium aurantiacum]|uniref:Transcriptional regulator, TetR family n=1 Tax=Cryptosporangium aurantiacum TaxID=134849 RepID=A0A1M7RAY5_9ACTN|nr:TetR family transcriptional regulator C-terminal domain-containing protein [Cryptosporangium aurantiacum]SHN43485.1 transcriptional regulator, TetR family [Cryptosporangium aurantiacum]